MPHHPTQALRGELDRVATMISNTDSGRVDGIAEADNAAVALEIVGRAIGALDRLAAFERRDPELVNCLQAAIGFLEAYVGEMTADDRTAVCDLLVRCGRIPAPVA